MKLDIISFGINMLKKIYGRCFGVLKFFVTNKQFFLYACYKSEQSNLMQVCKGYKGMLNFV